MQSANDDSDCKYVLFSLGVSIHLTVDSGYQPGSFFVDSIFIIKYLWLHVICVNKGLFRAYYADEKRAVDSLFIVNWTGTLTEYMLEPRVKSGLEKVTEESPIEVLARAWAQWPLAR